MVTKHKSLWANGVAMFLVAVVLTACQSHLRGNSVDKADSPSKVMDSKNLGKHKSFNFAGYYQALPVVEDGYQQTLSITPKEKNDRKHFTVAFSASEVRGRPDCSFSGDAWLDNQSLWVNISNEPKKEVLMYIRPLHDDSTLEVFTPDFDQRFYMMRYCRGGGSLAGHYGRVQHR